MRLFDQLLLFVFCEGSDGHAYAGILGYTASETAKQTGPPQRSIIIKSPALASLLPQWCHRLLQKLQLLLHVLGNVETQRVNAGHNSPRPDGLRGIMNSDSGRGSSRAECWSEENECETVSLLKTYCGKRTFHWREVLSSVRFTVHQGPIG